MASVSPTLKTLFSSKLRVKVLQHFFLHPGEEFYPPPGRGVLRSSSGIRA